MDNSWIKLHRKFLNSPLWKYAIDAHMPHLITLWCFLLMSANWEEKKWFDGREEILIPKGSFITSAVHLAKNLKLTRQQVRTSFDILRRMRMLTIKTTSRWTQLWIVNWTTYQMNSTQTTKPTTNEQPTNNQPITITKEYKKERTKEETYTSSNYLLNIPSNDLAELSISFVCTDRQIISKAQSLYDYCESTGKSYKDYKAFLRNALRKDFGERIEVQLYVNDLPQGVSETGLARFREMKEKILGNKLSN